MNAHKRSVKIIVSLSITLTICFAFLLYFLWQSIWFKKTVDRLADQAGSMQAKSEFHRGELVIWETVPTNDFPRYSGRHDGPFEIWFDEYHPNVPSAWKYGQRRLNDAHNAQMRLMYAHPNRFEAKSRLNDEAETVTKHFADALARFDAIAMVEEMHPDLQQASHQMAVRIIEATEPGPEQEQRLKEFGVVSLDELRKLTPKVAAIKFCQFAFSDVAEATKKGSVKSTIVIVGSVVENGLVHVLYKSESDFPNLNMNLRVPSVVTLERSDGRLMVVSTTQFELIQAKLGNGN